MADASQLSGLARWLRLRNLNPEQQVRYYYHAMLQRANRAGATRKDSETPLQYGPRLAEQIAAEDDDQAAIQQLTDAFVSVRYAQTSVSPEKLPMFKQLWQQLRKAIHPRQSSARE